MGKRKKDERPAEKQKNVRIEPPIQGILRENCTGSCLSNGGIFPRQHKGEYMCNVYSIFNRAFFEMHLEDLLVYQV